MRRQKFIEGVLYVGYQVLYSSEAKKYSPHPRGLELDDEKGSSEMLLEWRGKGSGRGTERQMTCVPGTFHVFSFNPCNFPVKNLMPIHRGEMRLGGLMCMDMSITIIGLDEFADRGNAGRKGDWDL